MDSSHSSARSSVSHNSVSSDVVVESFVPSGTVLNAFTEETVAYEKEKLNALCTPESFVTHSNFDTPSGTVYYILKVFADVLLVKDNVYDSVDDFVFAYMKYAAEAGFVVRRSCQKRMLNGDVKQKYLVCNRMGCPKGIHVDTLDLGNGDKQKRNSNLHITGCKARVVFNLDTYTRKFVLNVFDTIHNHELEREEYKHLSKTKRQLTYMKQAFIVKAASVNIGATRAHHFLTDNDAQMLIHKMENRKKHVSDFSFDYLVENAEITAIFWVDEVSKYNYKEFGDVRQTITGSVLRLLRVVVTDQDGAMRNAIEAEFGSEVCIIKESPYVYEMPNKKKKKPQSVDTGNDKAEENDKVDCFQKKMALLSYEVVFCVPECRRWIGISCSLCGGTDHNKRTCPRRFQGQDEVVVQKEVGQEEVLVQKEVCQEEVVQEKVDLAEDEEELSEKDEDLIHE
ncbi:protein FAR1-related sequence 5 [Tanacetum coccineum]